MSSFGLPRYFVNTVTLGLFVEDRMFYHNGLGPAVDLTISYNSLANSSGTFGRKWSFVYDAIIDEDGDRVILTKGSGQRIIFDTPGGTEYPLEAIAPAGKSDRLLYYGDYWLYYPKKEHLVYRFDRVPGSNQARMTTISDFNGNSLQVGFSSNGHISSITDSVGRIYTLLYNDASLCSGFLLPDGRSASFEYDSLGNLVRTVDLLGVTCDYYYAADSYITQVILGREKKTTQFSYQNYSNVKLLSAITDASGYTTTYEMVNAEPAQVKVTDPEGVSTLYASRNGVTEKVVDPLGRYEEYKYKNGLRTYRRYKSGLTLTMDYDYSRNLVTATDSMRNTAYYQYDDRDNLVKMINSLGEEWSYAYDERNNLIRVTSPLNNTQKMEYDSRGLLLAIVDANGSRTTFGYDQLGNLKTITDPMGGITTFKYDASGFRIISITDPLNNATSYEYDDNDRLVKEIHPDGSGRGYVYNCCAHILTTDENGNSYGYEIDLGGKVTRYIDRMGNHLDFRYDGNGNIVEMIDPAGEKTLFSYDPARRLVKITDPMHNEVVLNYDTTGHLITLKDPLNKAMRFGRNIEDLTNYTSDSAGKTLIQKHDAAGRVKEVMNARGQKVSYKYNEEGRVVEKLYDQGSIARYKYDSVGNLIRLDDSTGTTYYTYGPLNQLTSIEYPDGLIASFNYDLNGNIKNINYPGNLLVSYKYNQRNMVNAVVFNDNRVNYSYDHTGNLIGEFRVNGTESIYKYDNNKRFTEITHKKDSRFLGSIFYTYDALGNITEEVMQLPAEPLLPETTFNAHYNDLHQLVETGNDQYTYDDDGNLTLISRGKWQAKYDPENRPLEIARNGTAINYVYNGLGQRVKSVNGKDGVNYYYDLMGKLLFETDLTGNIQKYYIYNGPFLTAIANPQAEVFYYHFDKIGNTLFLTDKNGGIANAYSYTPYGICATTESSYVDNPFTYVGMFGVMDEGEGLYYMSNRYYDANSCRFIQKDPAGIAGGVNLYAYAGNNPVILIDPFGTSGKSPKEIDSLLERDSQRQQERRARAEALKSGKEMPGDRSLDLGSGNLATALLTGAVAGLGTIAAVKGAPIMGGVTVGYFGLTALGRAATGARQLYDSLLGRDRVDIDNPWAVERASWRAAIPLYTSYTYAREGNIVGTFWEYLKWKTGLPGDSVDTYEYVTDSYLPDVLKKCPPVKSGTVPLK